MTERETTPGALTQFVTGVRQASEALVEEVRDHYAAEVRVLRQDIRAGTMTRQAAITHLTERYQLTRVGASDLLDRS